jgi:hypothetical protein
MNTNTNQNTLPGTGRSIGELVSTLVKVKLTIGRKGGKLQADELNRETAAAHGANDRDISTQVKWLADHHQKELNSTSSRLRSGFNARTLPWEDGGYRVVPADRYQALCDFVAEAGGAFAEAAESIVGNWDAVIQEARTRLNGLFDKLDIPTAERFLNSIRYDMKSDVVVAPADMRIAGIAEATLERIRAQAEADYADRAAAGVDSLLASLTKFLTDLVARTDKDKQEGVRYGGWASRVKKAVGEMKHLNIVGDERLDALIKRVERIASDLDADAVREDSAARRKVRDEAVDALDCYGVK